MNELKPCPFCGGKAELEVSKHEGYCEFDYAKVSCIKCGAKIMKYIDVETSAKDYVIEAWNRRPENVQT